MTRCVSCVEKKLRRMVVQLTKENKALTEGLEEEQQMTRTLFTTVDGLEAENQRLREELAKADTRIGELMYGMKD